MRQERAKRGTHRKAVVINFKLMRVMLSPNNELRVVANEQGEDDGAKGSVSGLRHLAWEKGGPYSKHEEKDENAKHGAAHGREINARLKCKEGEAQGYDSSGNNSFHNCVRGIGGGYCSDH